MLLSYVIANLVVSPVFLSVLFDFAFISRYFIYFLVVFIYFLRTSIPLPLSFLFMRIHISPPCSHLDVNVGCYFIFLVECRLYIVLNSVISSFISLFNLAFLSIIVSTYMNCSTFPFTSLLYLSFYCPF